MKKSLSLAIVMGVSVLAPPNLIFAEENNNDESTVDEVVVTGSRIVRSNLVSSSPVTQVDAVELQRTGITRVEDLLNDLPQVLPSNTSGDANGATGTATIDLRGLGTVRTLVLLDGKRLPSGSASGGGIAPDLNQIPGMLIDRVEILTGGASATYGSDAIAGVVNFIMIDDFEGFKIDMQTSYYQHNNDNGMMQGLLADKNFEEPSSSVSDGDINDISMIMGANLDDGRGNVTAYASYRDIDPVFQADRDYSACALGGSPGSFVCGGSSTLPTGRFTDFGALGSGNGFDYIVQGDQFVDRDGLLYNYGPLNYYQRPDERWTLGAFGHYEVNDHADIYTQLMFTDDHTVAQIAPSGAFFVTDSLSCGNPLMSQQQFDAVCGSYGLTTADAQTVYIGRRNVEGGPRQADLRHTTFRTVLGLRGDINDDWSYDASYQYSEVIRAETYLNDLSTTKIVRALDVVSDPVTGEPVCASVLNGIDENCVPWNIFETGGATQEAVDYLVLPLYARGETDQMVVSGYVTGQLDFMQMPGADNAPAIVFGSEYREENLSYRPDSGYESGDGAGQGGPIQGVEGEFDVTEFFGELMLPLVEGKSFAEELTLDLAYRYSDYSTGIDTNTYKVAGSWSPVDDIKFRISYQHAVRHANIRELYRAQNLGLFDMSTDICSGPVTNGVTATGYTFEQCARTGVTADQFGNIADSPAGQYNVLSGGNPDLKPEESDTLSFGFVWTPGFIESLSVAVDYFDIDVTDAIDNDDPEGIVETCAKTNDSFYCDRINRGASTGTLWITTDNVEALDVNIGFLNVKGIDVSAAYSLDLGENGSIDFRDTLGYMRVSDEKENADAPVIHCAGKWGGGACGRPTPKLINNLRVTWNTPWDLSISSEWRHRGGVEDVGGGNADFSSFNYIDLSGIWNYTEDTSVRFGVNNLFDKEPPLTSDAGPSIFGNGNTFPGIYDALGRYLFMGASIQF